MKKFYVCASVGILLNSCLYLQGSWYDSCTGFFEMCDHFYQTARCQILERRIFITISVRTRRVMGQFSMLLFADCKIRKQESAKYFLCNTISFFVFVILPGSNTGNIFVDFWGRGITMKICWENPNLFKTEQTNFGQLTRAPKYVCHCH